MPGKTAGVKDSASISSRKITKNSNVVLGKIVYRHLQDGIAWPNSDGGWRGNAGGQFVEASAEIPGGDSLPLARPVGRQRMGRASAALAGF
jgi:hypothetical protein